MLLPILRNTEDWLDNSFENIFNDNWMPTMSTAAPAINVKENDKEYDVEVAAPGARKEDFNVNLDNDGNLVIKMEHKDEKKDENRGSSESHQACLNGRVVTDEGKANERRQYDNTLHLVNYRLKELSTMLKLQRPLTMYVARHSWASAAKSKNVPLSVISEGMGHDSEATTQIYLASLETSVVNKANKMILGLL